MVALESVEKSWMDQLLEEGREEGLIDGMRRLLLLQLSYKFGELPKAFSDQLYAVTDRERLSSLSEQVLTARSLDDITFVL